MKKTHIIIISILIIILGFCYLYNQSTTSNNEPIVIGYIGPMTGPSAVLGMDAVKALEIGVEEVNQLGGVQGRQVKLVSQDDQYLVKNTLSAYEKIVSTDKAKIVLVATYGGFSALKDKAIKDDVVLINPLDCNKDIVDASKNLFCLATETESIGDVLADHATQQDYKNIGIMYSTKDVFMNLVSSAFGKRYSLSGGAINIESFNYEDKDFKSQLSKLKQKNIDALVILGHDETGIIMKQARELGIKVQFYATGTITSPGAQSAANGNAEGTVFAFWDASENNTKSNAFIDKFKLKNQRPPILPLTTHPAYDTIKVLTDVVLPEVSSDINSEDVVRELLKVKNYQGITGNVTFDKNGAAPIKESAYRLIKGVPTKI